MLRKIRISVATVFVMTLAAWSGASFANVMNVGGVVWDPDSTLDLTIENLNLRETSVAAVGDSLTGYGRVASINGNTEADLCPGCDLTFVFDYTVKALGTSPNQAVFDNGTIDFYVDSSNSFDVTDPSTAGLGTLWLSLAGHEAPYTGYPAVGELYSDITGPVSDPGNGSTGFGLLDVIGGLAGSLFDTNTRDDGSDFSLNSSFQTAQGNICGVNVATGADDGTCYPVGGQAGLVGTTTAVPAPALGLMGFSLILLGVLVQRRRRNV